MYTVNSLKEICIKNFNEIIDIIEITLSRKMHLQISQVQISSWFPFLKTFILSIEESSED